MSEIADRLRQWGVVHTESSDKGYNEPIGGMHPDNADSLRRGVRLGDAPEPVNEQSNWIALAHRLWAAAQLVPGEGVEDGVLRIIEILDQGHDLPNQKDTSIG